MAKFVCKVCGYVYEGDVPPTECPVCHTGAENFEEVKGEMKLAAEHKFGVYDATVKNNPDIPEADKKYIEFQFDVTTAFDREANETIGFHLS